MTIEALFQNLCPNCEKGYITSEKLERGEVCENCSLDLRQKQDGLLYNVKKIENELDEIDNIFIKLTNSNMWSLQKFWCRKFLQGINFTISAPVGSGKTTTLIALALYSTIKLKKRTILILPTRLLVEQVYERIKRAGIINENEIMIYHSGLSEYEKKVNLSRINDAKIVITTKSSLTKKIEINSQKFDILLIDDVHIISKKIIHTILKILDMNEVVINEIINISYKDKNLKDIKERIKNQIKNKIIIISGVVRINPVLGSILGIPSGLNIEIERKVTNSYIKPNSNLSTEELLLELIKKLGGGCIIYVSKRNSKEYIKYLVNLLNQKGIKALDLLRWKSSIIHKFEAGSIDVLIGSASIRSPLVIGLDMPERVRYVIFLGVPKKKIEINLSNIRTEWRKIKQIIYYLKSIFPYKVDFKRINENVINDFINILENDQLQNQILYHKENNKLIFYIPNASVYLQGSGRTSRLYAGGLTNGLSIVIVDDERTFNLMKNDIDLICKFKDIKVDWKEFHELNLDMIIKEIDEDREKVKRFKDSSSVSNPKNLINTALIIVESPTKAKTIASLMGRYVFYKYNDLKTYEAFKKNSLYVIVSSEGHIVDLINYHNLQEGIFYGVAFKDNKFIPIYSPIKVCVRCNKKVEEDEEYCIYCKASDFKEKIDVIQGLRLLASFTDEVLIGTDPDREGEKIAWDIYLLLKPFNNNIKRIRFHEITVKAINEALSNPSIIDENLVKAQLVRRIEDRWIGFKLSEIIQVKFNKKTLSAGRVQTPVLDFIVERAEQNRKKIYSIQLVAPDLDGLVFGPFKCKRRVFKWLKYNQKVIIRKLSEGKIEEYPDPPFNTAELLSFASKKFKKSPEEVMRIAQRLFEIGLITYHRTDSVRVSDEGLRVAKEYICVKFDENHFKPRRWSDKNEESAHECIRPTKPIDAESLRELINKNEEKSYEVLNENDIVLYDIIFKRFMASQMISRESFQIEIEINIPVKYEGFKPFTKRYLKNIINQGFRKIDSLGGEPLYPHDKTIFNIPEGEVKVEVINIKQIGEQPLYTYSDIIELMKKTGIGRPSTFASTLSTLLKRRYVFEIKKYKGKLAATKLGKGVLNFLKENYYDYISVDTTRKLENNIDLIEKGEANYIEILKELYEEMLKIN
jgi:reverse gyrase